MTSTAARNVADTPRVARERRTVTYMIELYCRSQHQSASGLCERCLRLHSYAMVRLDRCVYRDEKPTCKQCPVHCYKRDMRDEMRDVMRYAGPRMLLPHPYLAIRHLLDERRSPPVHPKRVLSNDERGGPTHG